MIMSPNQNKNKILAQFILVGIAVVVMALIAGCTANFGSLKRDAEVQQAFESNQVSRDYKYFYFADAEPYVIFGIEPSYEMNSRMWREVSADTAEFKEMVLFIWEDYGYYKFGADILDPAGKKVGIMYTAINNTSVKFVSENEIVVIPGTPYLWGPGRGAGGGTRSR